MGVAVGDERVQLAIGQRGLVYGKPQAYILGEQQPPVCVVQLIPLTETAQHLLVLLLKGVDGDMVILFKRTAGHGGYLHTFLLKKLQIPWSSVYLWLRHQGLSGC